MASPPLLHDLACVVHLHSLYSDGTGTVADIAAAGRAAHVDVILLTDHDTLEAKGRGEEGWHGEVLLLVGEEVSPRGGDHYLAFGLDEPIEHAGMSSADICAAVEAAGGFGFAAHPFSKGTHLLKGKHGMPWRDLDCAGLRGIELWSFVTDTGERLGSWGEAARFIAAPDRYVDHPPEANMRGWDSLCAERRVVAIGGLDAHQIGKRVAGRVTLRLMSYSRSFRYLRTHVLCEELPTGELEHDRAQVYDALRSGRCYLARDSLSPGRGFAFWADGAGGVLPMGAEGAAGDWTLRARLPRPARLRLVRDGAPIAEVRGAELDFDVEAAGVYRAEAYLEALGSERTWLVSNPVYLR